MAPTWCLDEDQDGYGDDSAVTTSCDALAGYSAAGGDGDDGDASVNPEAEEDCDEVDRDCDGDPTAGAADGTDWYVDADGDGFGDSVVASHGCAGGAGTATVSEDCDDADASVNPAALDDCEAGLDRDCDGDVLCGYVSVDTEVGARWDGEGQLVNAGWSLAAGVSSGPESGELLLVGAHLRSETFTYAGAVYLVEPTTEGEHSLAEARAVVHGSLSGGRFGYAVAAVGDLDGDGASEWAASAPHSRGVVYVLPLTTGAATVEDVAVASFEGQVNLEYAGASLAAVSLAEGTGLLVGAPELESDDQGAGSVYLVDLPGSVGESLADARAQFVGEAAGDQAGSAVLSADLNGDGVEDLIAGASMARVGDGACGGAFYVVEGPLDSSVPLADADARVSGSVGSSSIGEVVAVGDVDGDGAPDLLVGAQSSSLSATAAGAVYLVRGPFSGTSDVDAAWAVLTGEAEFDVVGNALAFSDLDGDGWGELVIGAAAADGANGHAYVVFGPVPSGTTSLANADVAIAPSSPGQLGTSLMILGDADGDGVREVAVSADEDDHAAAAAGAVYLLPGGSLLDPG